ncbi:peptidase [Hymenobacter lapidiphilus]|uniref:LON peptidase substrate-binding domain-containing protein n=1 Tax=Hymenobacter sp. CCM 8763 TaxID=2303334 RepID=UPI000E3559B8|nr:LON peptidase substrate-binding domain-containing protein [Hymenobacter sp. CCM 8763]RFP64937.1 peptidase [Hymenobacter sp. CCM 8763]
MRQLALFPLNLVVFPGEKLNLHIFEPRYRQLVRDCLLEGIMFGIMPFLNGGVSRRGTEVRLMDVEKNYPSGELDIRTKAIGVFEMEDFQRELPGKLYAGASVRDLTDDKDADPALHDRTRVLIEQLYGILGLRRLFLDLPTDFRIYDVAHQLGMSTEQEYELLEADTEADRQIMALRHLEHILPVLQETERLKERVRLNGHFKNLTPPTF